MSRGGKKWWLLFLVATTFIGLGCSIQQVRVLLDSSLNESVDNLQKNVHIPVKFHKYVDGDTSYFQIKGSVFKTRYLLIDTPETVRPGTEPEPFGVEASNRTKELLSSAEKIEVMLDQGDPFDKYDRLLAYVFVDGELLQDILVREGLARVAYITEPSTKYLQQLQEQEERAKNAKLGIWNN